MFLSLSSCVISCTWFCWFFFFVLEMFSRQILANLNLKRSLQKSVITCFLIKKILKEEVEFCIMMWLKVSVENTDDFFKHLTLLNF